MTSRDKAVLFAQNMRTIRKHKHMTQAQLGKKIFAGYSAVYAYESGRNIIPLDRAIAVCDLFGVSMDDMRNHVFKYEEGDDKPWIIRKN